MVIECKCACAGCGEVIEYFSNRAGKVVKCSKCGEESRLPEPEKLGLLKPSGPPTPEFKTCVVCGTQLPFFNFGCPVCEKASKQKTLRTRIMIAVSTVVVLVAGVLPAMVRGTGPRGRTLFCELIIEAAEISLP